MRSILIHFAESDLAAIEAVCKRTLSTRAAFIRKCVQNGLDPKTGIEARIIFDAEKAASEAENKQIAEAQSKP